MILTERGFSWRTSRGKLPGMSFDCSETPTGGPIWLAERALPQKRITGGRPNWRASIRSLTSNLAAGPEYLDGFVSAHADGPILSRAGVRPLPEKVSRNPTEFRIVLDLAC